MKQISIDVKYVVETEHERVRIDDMQELWKTLHVDTDEYMACRGAILRELACFSKADLSKAYGQTVIVRMI